MPLVADFFADDDTREIAHACRKLDDLKRGFQWKTLEPALEALAEEAPSPPLGVICGAGFEDRTPSPRQDRRALAAARQCTERCGTGQGP